MSWVGKPEVTVHALKHGIALCGFMRDTLPGEWPHPHKWVGWHWKEANEVVNCEECRRKLTFGSVAHG